MSPEDRLQLVCLPLLAAAVGAMCLHLGSKPFWVDECIAVLPAHAIHSYGVPRNPFDLDYMAWQLQDGVWDPSAPLYRYVVAGITLVTGFDETTTRGISVAFAVLALVLCFRLFARTDGRPTAWVAVTFLAASSMLIEHAREARHFTFVLAAWCACLLLLERAAESKRARVWWPPALVATLLGHAMGYLVVPVVLGWLALNRRERWLERRGAPVYAVAGGAYAVLIACFWRTLPFVHHVGCSNRTVGCEPSPWFYLGTLHDFLRGGPGPRDAWALLDLGPWLFAAGLALTLAQLRRARHHALYLLWLAAPLLALSAQELKFPRYILYIMPAAALLLARGAVAAIRLPGLRRFPTAALGALLLLAVVAPRPDGPTGLASGALEALRPTLAEASDNWDHIRAKTEYLRAHATPEDTLVATMDDASLGYYLGRFVYGFVNSGHDDGFFLGLLADAARRGAKVWVIDDLPAQNHCHERLPELHNVDCREKYAGFWRACTPDDPAYDPHCIRVTVR